MLYFEDLEEGQEFRSPGRTITEADVVAFAGLSGDYHPLHTDEEYAKQTPYGRRVAHGLLTLAIASGLALRGPLGPESVIAFSGLDKLRFTRPVFIGDTLSLTQTVLSKRPQARLGGGLVSLACAVRNQRGEVVLRYEAKLLVRSRSPGSV